MRQYLRVVFILTGALVLVYLLNEYNKRLEVEVSEEVTEEFQAGAEPLNIPSDPQAVPQQQQQVPQAAPQQQSTPQQVQQQQRPAQQQQRPAQQQQRPAQQQQKPQQLQFLPGPSDGLGQGEPAQVPGATQQVQATRTLPADCFPKDQLKPSELLPGDANSKWAQVNPVGQGELKDVNFLEAGYHVGVNTVGQSLRNANRQLRSEPLNPQAKVSPWNQTTIEPDINRRPLEIGSGN